MTHIDRHTHKWKRKKTDILYQREKYTLMFVHSVSMCVLTYRHPVPHSTYGGQKTTRCQSSPSILTQGPLCAIAYIPQASGPGSKRRGILLSPQNLPLQCCGDRQALPHQLYVDSGDPHSGAARALIPTNTPAQELYFKHNQNRTCLISNLMAFYMHGKPPQSHFSQVVVVQT